MFQLIQCHIRGHDQRQLAAVSAVNDIEYLLQSKLGASFNAKVINNQQPILIIVGGYQDNWNINARLFVNKQEIILNKR